MDVSKEWVFTRLVIIALCFGLSYGAYQDDGIRGGQKKTLNDGLVTIQIGKDDIYDCVDINKQPSLDHPSLKGHKIQMEPTSIPRANVKETFENSAFHADVIRTRCPSGTVPIQRVNNATQFKTRQFFSRRNGSSSGIYKDNDSGYDHFFVPKSTWIGTYHGGKVSISLHALDGLNSTQKSGAAMWLTDDSRPKSDQIGAGWTSSRENYPDYQPRLTAFWATRDGGGCSNIRCPGFVQISREISLGAPFSIVSKFQGTQIHMTVVIYNDPKTHNWWLLYGEHLQVVGYWPGALFLTLSESASVIFAGGYGASDSGEKGPPIGSGHYPDEGFRRAAYVKKIEIVDTSKEPIVFLNAKRWFSASYKIDSCYGLGNLHDDDRWGLSFFYGGPGGCGCRYDCHED